MAELQQTKNLFKVVGKVTRIDKDNAFKEDVVGEGKKREGDTYRSLRFAVKTSESNEITVEMFDYQPEQVFMWRSDERKKNPQYKGDRIPFQEWYDNQDEYREKGYAIIEPRVGLEYKEDGKLDSKGLPSFEASKYIYDNLSNGDSVVVEGEIRYSKYTNRDGKVVEQKTHTIKKLFKLKDVNFEDEKFEEVSYFEQEFVFIDAMVEKTEGKAFVTARHINYNKTWHDTQLIVDFSDGNGGYDKSMVKLAEAFAKKVKFGDVLKVYGDTLNRVIVEEVEDEDNGVDEDLLALGGKAKPKHAQAFVSRTYITEMQIHGVEAWDKKIYKEDDFKVDELIEKNEFEGMGKSKKENPFGNIDEGGDDISEEDLPF